MGAAQENLDSIRGAGLTEIDELLAKMGAILQAGTGSAEARELYRMSNLIIGYAGAFGMNELSQAAYSLCETLDGMINGQRWRKAPVEVHVAAMGRLRQVDGNQEICQAIIDGLKKVAAHAAQE
ncbi:MAG TPA: hypothetical protein VMU59_13500 [Caulobacteraceae bacterium]|nr:hypothetical protein [Caulobacteraceae bacterium]